MGVAIAIAVAVRFAEFARWVGGVVLVVVGFYPVGEGLVFGLGGNDFFGLSLLRRCILLLFGSGIQVSQSVLFS